MSPITQTAPFVVETFACDVEVLGTHFDVVADEAEKRFFNGPFDGRGCCKEQDGR